MLTARVEIRAVQVHRATVERMEKRPRQRCKNCLPTEQAKQATKQGVFHVMHPCLVLVQVVANGNFHTAVRWERQRRSLRTSPIAFVVLWAGKPSLRLFMGLRITAQLFQHANLPPTGFAVLTLLIERQRRL